MKKTLIFTMVVAILASATLFYSCSREVAQPSNNQSQVDDGGNNNNNNNNNNNQNNVSYGPLDLVITEINWGGSYSNDTSATADGEFVEIMNNTTNTINLGGFQLRYDGGGSFTNKRVTLPSTLSLAPGEFLVVFITNNTHNPYSLVVNTGTYKRFLWSGINYIGNSGFRVAIIAPNGDEIDFVETRSGQPGQVTIKGSSGAPKRTMERVLPFISGTNDSAWDAAVSNVNYAYGGANNLGTPGASNSVWFVYATISLVQPINGASINNTNTNVVFSWSVSGGSGYSSYIFRITSNDVVIYSTNTSINSNVVNVSGLEAWNGYKWFVLGVSGSVTNSSATNGFEIVTTGGGSGSYSPLDLVITEINWGGSYSNNNTNAAIADGEFVEIMNNTSSPINLAGFQLRYDGGGSFTNKRVTLPSIVLNPGEFLVAFITNSSHNPYALVLNTNTYKTFLWTGINYIANTGFRIAIIDPSSNEIDFVETRSGQPGQVAIKGSSGTPKRTMERVLPFISGTNDSAWDAAVSNINYAYGGANNLGTPGASNSVWLVYATITLVQPVDNASINKSNTNVVFSWSVSGGSGYSSYIFRITSNDVVIYSTNTSINSNVVDVSGLEAWNGYKWFVLGAVSYTHL
ncbi:MAG: lamin tail domain-containing protein, partial [Spirochaetes bacterium]|nr:lamin tail domain-containing protein [Spirochaetota bacterium]